MKRRLLAIVMAVMMAVALCPAASAASVVDSGTCGGNVNWTFDSEGTLTISGTGKMEDYEGIVEWEGNTGHYRYTFPWYSVQRGIKKIVIQDGVTSIGEHAFSDCENLVEVSIPDSVTSIGNHAFQYCERLAQIVIPNNVSTISERAFSGCKSLEQVRIPDSVTAIGAYAFDLCESLNRITIPSSVKIIEECAFVGCKKLADISIPEGVITIEAGAFYACVSLKSAAIPASVTAIGDGPFLMCPSMLRIDVSPKNVRYAAVDGVLFDKSMTTLISYPAGRQAPSYTVPAGVTSIGAGAFSAASNLTDITFPDGLTSIGESAFYHCTALTSITIPDSVREIGKRAFWAFDDESFPVPMPGLTLCGSAGSYAESYARAENIPFRPVSSSAEITASSFTDVPAGEYYAQPVAWAVAQGITNGTTDTTFSPGQTCTQAQILTFLHRAAGKPAAKGSVSFPVDEAYREALCWAADLGMIDRTSFRPNDPCTRATAVSYIWQAKGRPSAAAASKFTDVDSNAPYAAAVSWAVGAKVTEGTTAATFSPGQTCTRGQIVTFLHRAMAG